MLQPERPTVVVSRRVRPGCEASFEEWVAGFTAAASRAPGWVSHQVVPPLGEAQPDWVFVFTFDTSGHLKAWVESPIRANWLLKAELLVQGEARAQLISGLEVLFGLDRAGKPPAVWKLAVATFLGLWPVAYLNAVLLGPWLSSAGPGLRTFLISAVTVAQMTWIVMPLVTRALKAWLQPNR